MNEKITHIDLFSGIGGFALAADRVFGEVEHIFCDNEPFAQEVLKKHWPHSKIYGDIRAFTYADHYGLYGAKNSQGSGARKNNHKKGTDKLREPKGGDSIRTPFILTGGFPCQPFSQAGRRRGEEDDRFLWPEMCRVIGEFKPTWVIAENVRGLLTQGGGVVFERVCTDLEALGYEVQPLIIPAVAVGAPHRRDRVWFVARRESSSDAERERHKGDWKSRQSDARRNRCSSGKRGEKRTNWNRNWLEVATRLCRVDDGLPRRLDRNPRLKALGNAIVPQVAEEIMRAIKYAEET